MPVWTALSTLIAVIGGVAGAGIAVGPILGGWATTELSWRIVFAGEVVLSLCILLVPAWPVLAKRLSLLRCGSPMPGMRLFGLLRMGGVSFPYCDNLHAASGEVLECDKHVRSRRQKYLLRSTTKSESAHRARSPS